MSDVDPRTYQPPRDLLAGRIILVTGAGAGIGRAASLCFARHGAQVILLGRTVRKLEAVYDEIVAANHPQPAIYPMDLQGALPAHHTELAERVEGEFGRLDGLLHNAATLGELTPIEHYDAELWLRVFQVNVHAAFLMTRACLPLLQRAQNASIVFTSSSVGRSGRAYWGAYAASKFAIEGLVQVLADELEQNTTVRVNSINPGRVRTAMRSSAYPGEDPETLPPPEAVMPAYLFLLGADSGQLNGAAVDAQ